jgi:glycine/D-amino acid oxidase-like deaminating enzyme
MGALFPSNLRVLPAPLESPCQATLPDHDGRVSPEQMLRELERLARRLGLTVRFEAFDRGGTKGASRRGGLCTLRGAPIVLVDAHAPTIDKVGVLCEAIARFDIEVLYIPPILRARLHRLPQS